MKFIDSNIIAYAFYCNEHTDACQKLIQEGGIIDTFNLTEAFFIIEKEVNREYAQKVIRGLLKSSLTIIDVTPNTIFEILRRTSKYKLSVFDLVHYTCALMSGCTSFVSYDPTLTVK
ncbi:MAG TPA: PIN domain-containing protein [Candidatus Nanoarchaeia archaeon]|nr:PIN domain-containing protein [Candidatus Nanoarchaeia archaeon]